MKLRSILTEVNDVKVLKRYTIFSFKEFKNVFIDHIEDIELKTFWLTPFYYVGGLYEMYHYELTVIEAKKSKKKKLRKTLGTKNEECLTRWDYCYVEVLPKKEEAAKKEILAYFDKVLYDKDFSDEIKRNFNEFDLNKIYFEVYIEEEF